MKYKNPIETHLSKRKGYAIVQLPNPPIIVFAIFFLLFLIAPHDSMAQRVAGLIAFGGIFTWAWLELFYGLNLFRRILGAIVFVVIIMYAANHGAIL